MLGKFKCFLSFLKSKVESLLTISNIASNNRKRSIYNKKSNIVNSYQSNQDIIINKKEESDVND